MIEAELVGPGRERQNMESLQHDDKRKFYRAENVEQMTWTMYEMNEKEWNDGRKLFLSSKQNLSMS